MTNIDFKPLQNKLAELFPGKSFNIVSVDPSKRPTIQHDDLIDAVGIFALAIKEVSVGFFGYNYHPVNNTLWGNIDIFYASHTGGSNGMEIMSVWMENDEWTFKLAKK